MHYDVKGIHAFGVLMQAGLHTTSREILGWNGKEKESGASSRPSSILEKGEPFPHLPSFFVLNFVKELQREGERNLITTVMSAGTM